MRSLRAPLLVAALTAALVPEVASAKGGGDIDLQAFHPAIDSRGFITVNASETLGPGELSFGLVSTWAHNVLNLVGADWDRTPQYDPGKATYQVQNVITSNLQFAIGIIPRLEVGVTLPLQIVSGDRGPDFVGVQTDPKDDKAFGMSAQGLGDIDLHAKFRIWDTSHHPIGLALIGVVTVPGGYDKQSWLGEGATTIVPKLVVDKELASGTLRLGANVGFTIRTGDHKFVDTPSMMGTVAIPNTGKTVEAKSDIPFGAAIAYSLSKQKFDVVGEVFGALPLGGTNYFPLEADAGIKLYLAHNSFFLLGGGVGMIPGEAGGANPDFRAFIGIVFEPLVGDRDGDGIKDDVDKCPDDPEDKDGFEDEDGCPDPDNDKDGIPDKYDHCVDDPEDKDGHEDEDGCPEQEDLDRDGDGIPDKKDKCPDDPEDKDGFQDEDGCPDDDNDKDGIKDVNDLCPNDPEDKDGFKDDDGCPDDDNDNDRIPDKSDKCPNDPENYNGVEDDDGCPDRGRVIVHQSNIEILDKIYFETGKAVIKKESYGILDAIAATLQGNPDIQLIEIQGHTDERGNDKYNLKLSDDRAHAVMEYLVKAGVDESRLTAKGYGETQPIVKGHNEKAWSQNRRVEFVILKREGQDSPP